MNACLRTRAFARRLLRKRRAAGWSGAFKPVLDVAQHRQDDQIQDQKDRNPEKRRQGEQLLDRCVDIAGHSDPGDNDCAYESDEDRNRIADKEV